MREYTGGDLRRKLLAVSWAMPPLLVPQAIQISRILKALSSFDWHTTVLCAETAVIDRKLPHDAQLSELTAGSYRTFPVKPPVPLRPLHSHLGYRLLNKLQLSNTVWQRWATRAALGLIKAEDFATLVTFGQPWIDHVIGLDIHRQTGIPWVAHFSDPWIDSPWVNKADRNYPTWCKQEEATIREADAVIFTTEHTVDLVMRKYPREYRTKVSVVPHGFDPDVRRFLTRPPEKSRLRMVSTGNFYFNRTPIPLFHALEKLNRAQPLAEVMEVILVGPNNVRYAEMAAGMGLGEVVSGHDAVPFMQSMQIAAGADVLLAIDAPTDGPSVFLPSKLIDYLVLEKPIFGITPLDGTSADLLRRADCPVAAPTDSDAITGVVTRLLESWKLGRLGVSPAFAKAARDYEIKRTTRVFDTVLRDLTSRGSGAVPPVGNLAG